MAKRELWKEQPDDHDYPAAQSFLSMLATPDLAEELAGRLREAPVEHFLAKDLLRAARLAPLGPDNVHVAGDLKKVKKGRPLSPVLLVRGRMDADIPLVVADGYHRICASYHLDEDASIPCRLVDLRPGRAR